MIKTMNTPSPVDILKPANTSDQRTQIKTYRENHKNNFVEITIYKDKERFAFAYKIKVAKIIRQKIPHENDFTAETEYEAVHTAKTEIKKQCSHNREAKNILVDFTTIYYNQLELF